jgi:hypothetical protein
MVMKMKLYFIFVIFLSFGSEVQAKQIWSRIHRWYQSPRALAMGDAFTAVSDDYSALFYNPAGLSRIKNTQVNLSLDVGVTSSFSAFADQLKKINAITDPAQKTNASVQLLQENFGNIYGGRFGLFHGAIASEGWGFAILPADATIELAIQNQAFPTLAVRAIADSTIAYGYGARVMSDDLGGKLDWGITGKAIHRAYLNETLNAIDLALDSNFLDGHGMSQGYLLDADIGFLYSPYLSGDGLSRLLYWARPTFGFVLRNVLGGRFQSTSSSNDRPESMYPVVDIGTRWEYPEFWIFGGRGVMDFRNIGHPQYSFKKGFHLGFEFDWRVASWWKGQYRVGLSQGYLTAGLSALLGIWRLDLVTYGEEAGTENYPKESRIYMARFNLDF